MFLTERSMTQRPLGRPRGGCSVARSPISQNVFNVTGRIEALLYVKGRAEQPYRWGVTANVVERLRRQAQRWFVVLLFESVNTGYLLSSEDVLGYVRGTWPLGTDGDYKPASGTYLVNNMPFASFDEFIRQLRGGSVS